MLIYQVVSNTDIDAFNQRLRELCQEGWIPDGELIVVHLHRLSNLSAHLIYAQRVYKDETQ